MGVYMKVNNSAPNKEGDKAVLVTTEDVDGSLERCFSLWYHMFGEDVGNLIVYASNSQGVSPLWQRSGNQVI